MTTQQLVRNHVEVIYQLEKDKKLSGNICNFIRLPFESYEKSVFRESRSTSKPVLTNSEGDVVQFCDVQVEIAVLLTLVYEEANKSKTIKVTQNPEKPNIVFFKEVDRISSENAQLVADISIQLWMLIKTKQVNNKQLQKILKDLTAILIHHTKKNDISNQTKILLYSNPSSGEYLAPLAMLQDNATKELIQDYKTVIETGELPSRVSPLTQENFTSIRKQIRSEKDKAIADLRDAIYDSKQDTKRRKQAEDILKKHFNMNLVQALDFLHLHGMSQDSEQIEMAEELLDSTLKYVARDEDPIEIMPDEAREEILSEYLVETFQDRLE